MDKTLDEQIADLMRQAVLGAVRPLLARVEALEAEVQRLAAELEQRP
ncbi:hypothetical protein [Acidovorax lacteus]|uniref:IS66 family transposase n=1 Tax=Acidovorax lacteus TaxID=1924988 RepID=A0ABP8L1J0_9BURK